MKEHTWNDVLNKKSVIYLVENNKSKENTSQKMRRCVQTFDWYCTIINLFCLSNTHTHGSMPIQTLPTCLGEAHTISSPIHRRTCTHIHTRTSMHIRTYAHTHTHTPFYQQYMHPF